MPLIYMSFIDERGVTDMRRASVESKMPGVRPNAERLEVL